MATNQTTNYQLNQWLSTDQVLRTDFNANNAKVDTALKGVTDALENEVTARTEAVLEEAAARETAVAAERQARIAAISAQLKIAAGSYVGNRAYGSTAARTLDFTNSLGRPPIVVFFLNGNSDRHPSLLFGGMKWGFHNCTLTWSENKLTWYGDTPDYMLNHEGETYYYFALG